MALQLTWTKASDMSQQRGGAFVYHTVACLLFPLVTSLGFQFYITLFGPPLSKGVAIGLAVQLIFAAFVLANALIAMTTDMKVKIVLTSKYSGTDHHFSAERNYANRGLRLLAHRASENPMAKKTFTSALSIFVAIALLAPLVIWLYVKLDLSRNTKPYSTTWSDSGACYINSYIPNYWSLGIPGITVELFSSQAFFRVYRKDGTLLKSSEWLLTQREFADSESAQWTNGNVIYPTNSGYEGWTLPVCG